jgi:hypothetical protein
VNKSRQSHHCSLSPSHHPSPSFVPLVALSPIGFRCIYESELSSPNVLLLKAQKKIDNVVCGTL